MSDDKRNTAHRMVDPDFDGHLSTPFERMTTEQRLDWLWQVIVFRASVTSVDGENDNDQSQGSDPPSVD